ncbi:MAG: hypothetical protein AAGG07_08145 [Planctomycetota bacterium]
MTAAWTWSAYLVLAFGVAPLLFRIRFRRWPFVPPRLDEYSIVEVIYATLLGVYTAWLWLDPAPVPVRPPFGWLFYSAGAGLVLLSSWSMGKSWRIGQDASDPDVEHVATTLQRWLSHPIYVGLVLLALGQCLLDGRDAWPRSMLLLGSTMTYVLVQGRAEARRWSGRL